MSRLYRTAGIVLRRREQGDADRVLTLCTPQGKIDVLAKGARKLRSRKAGHIELFAHSNFVLSQVPHYWDIISQAETVEPHAPLRDDLLRGAYARYAVELLDRFFTEGEGGQALFDLLDHTLTWLCEDDDPDLSVRFYEQHLLGLAGFRPQLFQCVGEHQAQVPLRPFDSALRRAQDNAQGRPPAPAEENRPYGFDPERGGALCRECYAERAAPKKIAPLSPNGLWFLQECQRGPYSRLRTRPVAPALHAEAERVMQHYITYHLEQGVKSGTFLRRLREI